MFDYHAANDETIIARSHDGDDAATDFLLEKYKPLVKKKARTLFLIGGHNDSQLSKRITPTVHNKYESYIIPPLRTLRFSLH